MLNVYLYTKKYLYLIQKITIMVEPLLSGIVLGLITVSAFGLFVAAFLQYRRGSKFEIYLLILENIYKYFLKLKKLVEENLTSK